MGNNELSNISPIGFFDSGVGGLSVYSRFKQSLPNENTLYFGDLKNMPYGNKTKDELVGFARNILNFFKSKNVKAVVIACNTSSAIAYDLLKGEYDFKIYPIIQMCAQKVASYGLNKIGVFATLATVNSNAYKRELEKYSDKISVVQVPCPMWTSWVETDNVSSSEAQIDINNLMNKMLSNKPDKIILGCTHYPYLLSTLTKYAPADMFIDPAIIFVEAIKEDLEKSGLLNMQSNSNEEFYVSANPHDFQNNSKLFYNVTKTPIVYTF